MNGPVVPADRTLTRRLVPSAAFALALLVCAAPRTPLHAQPTPPAAQMPQWRRNAVVALWAAAGVGAAFVLPGAFVDVARKPFRLLGADAVSLFRLAAAIAAGTAATWAATAHALRD